MKLESLTEEDVEAILARLEGIPDPATTGPIRIHDKHSNYLAEVPFADGRRLMIKRARYAELAMRFRVSRTVARLLRERTGIVAPDYLPLQDAPDHPPTLVYWRIPLPTLEHLWPDLPGERRVETLRSWGVLIRHMQEVRFPGHGPLLEATVAAQTLAAFLRADLVDRLLPSARGAWPAGVPAIDGLVGLLDRVDRRFGRRGGVLVHNDLFTANVLCEPQDDGRLACVGVLDLEDAFAGPPEGELAKTEILHGPLFGRPWTEPYFDEILRGYDAPLDPLLVSFFRAYHMANMGFHAAVVGYDAHADEVARACRMELDAAGSGDAHRDVLAGLREGVR